MEKQSSHPQHFATTINNVLSKFESGRWTHTEGIRWTRGGEMRTQSFLGERDGTWERVSLTVVDVVLCSQVFSRKNFYRKTYFSLRFILNFSGTTAKQQQFSTEMRNASMKWIVYCELLCAETNVRCKSVIRSGSSQQSFGLEIVFMKTSGRNDKRWTCTYHNVHVAQSAKCFLFCSPCIRFAWLISVWIN